MNLSFLLILLAAAAQSDAAAESPRSNEVPQLLERAFLQRLSYKTASFRVREENIRNGWATAVSNREMKWAGDSFWCRDEGDDDGMLRYGNARTGEVPLGVASCFLPEERVVDAKSGSMWARATNSPFTTKAGLAAWFDYVDVRTVGLRSIVLQQTDPHSMLESLIGDGGLSFETLSDRNGLAVIRGVGKPNSDKTCYECEWEIDRDKGPSVVCARQFLKYSDGHRELSSEAKTSLKRTNGMWWPSRVEFDFPGSGRRTFEFRNVEFNESQHPPTIDADALGLPIGAPIYPQGLRRTDRYMGAGVTIDDATWKSIKSGYDTMPYRDFSNRAVALGRGEFPSWWTSTDGTEGISDIGDRPDQWEAYVRRWVMRRTNHHAWHVIEPLSDIQRTKAKGILDECRKMAIPIRTRLDKDAADVAIDLAAAEKALKDFRSASEKIPASEADAASVKKIALDSDAGKEKLANEEKLTAKIKALQQRKAELAKSPEIERIFDELKARLEGMLTTRQKDPGNGSFQRPTPPPLPQSSRGARPIVPPSVSTTSKPSVIK